MNIEELKNMIKPELESVFGSTMTNLILTRAKMKVSSGVKDIDDISHCRLFIEYLGRDEMVLGMWGSLEVEEKVSKWLNYIN